MAGRCAWRAWSILIASGPLLGCDGLFGDDWAETETDTETGPETDTDETGDTGEDSPLTRTGPCSVVGQELRCYSYAAATLDVGACVTGMQICSEDGDWGPCEGEQGPRPEACTETDGHESDEDCDGDVDEPDAQDCKWFMGELDGDLDGFAPGLCLCQPDARLGYTIEAPGNAVDCCDSDPAVRPDQLGYFDAPSVCGDYDYDCDQAVTKEADACADCSLGQPGWDCVAGEVPDCGAIGAWVVEFMPGCVPVPESRTMRCR